MKLTDTQVLPFSGRITTMDALYSAIADAKIVLERTVLYSDAFVRRLAEDLLSVCDLDTTDNGFKVDSDYLIYALKNKPIDLSSDTEQFIYEISRLDI